MDQFTIRWIDAGREPVVSPNPNYPNGIDLDLSNGTKPACFTKLPYPAKRIGGYLIECAMCGGRFGCTTAGRPDDPRSIVVPCKRRTLQ